MRELQELWPQDRKNWWEQKTSGVLSSAEWRDQGQLLLTHGKSSVNHIAQVSQQIELHSHTGFKVSWEILPNMVLKTSYRHLLQSLHQKEAGRNPTRSATEDVWKTFESSLFHDCWTWAEGQTCIWGQRKNTKKPISRRVKLAPGGFIQNINWEERQEGIQKERLNHQKGI